MRTLAVNLAFTLLAFTLPEGAALAQQPPQQQMKTFTSAADVQALIAKAKAARKGNQPIVIEPILSLAPYRANLEYRASVGPAALHEKEAEVFYVIQGSATMTTGGKLVNEKRTNAENMTGTGIEGGMSRKVSTGDFLIVPENTPHWVSQIDGVVVFMTLHIPRPVPGR
jgi:mannose-6-phosphate isomerase-like protein (cupin superfamily)